MANFKDKTEIPVEGHFSIKTYVKGVLVDTYEQKNQIMYLSKYVMSNAISGNINRIGNPSFISTFVLGTQGHNTGNILSPKEFTYDEEDIFSAAPATEGDFYPITWNPSGQDFSGQIPRTSIAEGYKDNAGTAGPSQVYGKIISSPGQGTETIEYKIVVGEDQANFGGVAAFTEAGLYSNMNRYDAYDNDGDVDSDISTVKLDGINDSTNLGTLFAMRTFPAKVKDAYTKFEITWKIVF